MNPQLHRLGAIVAALIIVVGLGAGTASGKKKGKRLKVTCEQLYAQVEKTGAQLQAQYNAMGFTVDGYLGKNTCRKKGKRVRFGGGFMNDIQNDFDPPFPGETNPAVREYFWTWSQKVVRTKKGKLRSKVTDIRCEKYIYEGSPSSPQGVVTLPC
ncbi:MAG: hypothetical protein ACRDL6_04095 [Solirubrobacterales bacterium]